MGILRLLLEVVVRGGDVRRAQKLVKASKNCRPPSWGVLGRIRVGGAKFSIYADWLGRLLLVSRDTSSPTTRTHVHYSHYTGCP